MDRVGQRVGRSLALAVPEALESSIVEPRERGAAAGLTPLGAGLERLRINDRARRIELALAVLRGRASEWPADEVPAALRMLIDGFARELAQLHARGAMDVVPPLKVAGHPPVEPQLGAGSPARAKRPAPTRQRL